MRIFSSSKPSNPEILNPKKKLYELEYSIKQELLKKQSDIGQSKNVEKMFRQLDWSVKYLNNFSKISLEKRIGNTHISLAIEKQKMNFDSHDQLPMYQKLDYFFNNAEDMLDKIMAGNEELREGAVFDRFVEIAAEVKGPQRTHAKFKIGFLNGVVYLREMEPFPNTKSKYPGSDKVDPSLGYFFKDNEFHLEAALLEYLRLFGINAEFCEKLCATSYYLDLLHKAKFFATANTIFESS